MIGPITTPHPKSVPGVPSMRCVSGLGAYSLSPWPGGALWGGGGDWQAGSRLRWATGLALLLVVASASSVAVARAATVEALKPGHGERVFVDPHSQVKKPVRVVTWTPSGGVADRPILIVMHGMHRDPDAYLEPWIEWARRHRVILAAPEFHEAYFPGSHGYNLGNIFVTPLFDMSQVIDWRKLHSVLRRARRGSGTSAEQHLWTLLREEGGAAIAAAVSKTKLAKEDQFVILSAINRALAREDFFKPEAFAALLDTARRSLPNGKNVEYLSAPEAMTLHRALLEGLWPGCFAAAEYRQLPRSEWTFQVVEHLVDHLREAAPGARRGYWMFGHSAGAQFVHRHLVLLPRTRCTKAVAANAGRYLWPDPGVDYPYGVRGLRSGRPRLATGLRRPLWILAGTEDDDPEAEGLNRSAASRAQGAHRLARARNFHQAAEAAARKLRIETRWRLRIVDGVGHDCKAMAKAAAPLFLER